MVTCQLVSWTGSAVKNIIKKTLIQATTLFILKSEVVPYFLNNKCNSNLNYNMKGHLRG